MAIAEEMAGTRIKARKQRERFTPGIAVEIDKCIYKYANHVGASAAS
ncbi:MAG TPA: hypothetical protein VFV38_45190 [Ktedonobacteraceae bacterium]|nr:hypothetical protein [Ktedonobacteraceae bacterium]